MTMYFGFAMSDSMFNNDCAVTRSVLSIDEVRVLLPSCKICANPSHKATFNALRERYGVSVEIPDSPPRVALNVGDSLIVMTVRGLPRLTDRHEYTESEIQRATFTFACWTVTA